MNTQIFANLSILCSLDNSKSLFHYSSFEHFSYIGGYSDIVDEEGGIYTLMLLLIYLSLGVLNKAK